MGAAPEFHRQPACQGARQKDRPAAEAAAMIARQIAARGRLCAGEGWPLPEVALSL